MNPQKDSRRYYRVEAREIVDGMSTELLALSRGESRPDAASRLFRQAHTLKGAATVVGDTAVVETARILEDVLGVHRDTNSPLSTQEITEFLHMVEALESFIVADAPAENATDAAPVVETAAVGSNDALTTVRVELDELDDVAASLAGAELQSSALLLAMRDLDATTRSLEALIEQCMTPRKQDAQHAVDVQLTDGRMRDAARELMVRLGRTRRLAIARSDTVARELQQARERVTRLELVPAGNAFPALERAAQLAASAVGKAVRFETIGGEVRVDRRVLPVVREALLHLVRNAVDHGIESSDERQRLGKPSDGHVTLSVQRRGSRVVFACEDDGTGIDPDAIRRFAIDRRLMSAAEVEQLDDAAVLRLLFRAGVSTRTDVTDLSGRGVGLDVVGAAASTLRGDAKIASRIGFGTRVELVVPVSLSTATVVALRVEDTILLLPLDSVRSVFRTAANSLVSSPLGEAVLYESEMLRVLRLGPALGLSSKAPEGTSIIVVFVINVGSERFAIVADAALGNDDVVVRPLPWAAGCPLGVAGAAVDAEAVPKLVLDPRGLLAILQHHAGVAPEPAAPRHVRRFLPILVIDDSLTTRMLEQSILQTAGFEVDVATSAEEALGMARAREYGLFVVDVEMPGMNGFEFTATTRSDSRLKEVAVILVTSLSSEADKRRGREVGAAAYVVKGQFDQNDFLARVRSLSRDVA